ncbi:MAG: putative drug exporter of the superfamily [Acidimicrobiaceae bacterium]
MLKRIAGVCYRRRWRVLIGWVVVLVGINAVGGAVGSSFGESFHLPSTDSQKAFDLLDKRFPARAGQTAFIVFKATPTIDAQKPAINRALDELRGVKSIIEVRALTASPQNPQIAFAEMQFQSASGGRQRLSQATLDAVKAVAAKDQPGLQMELSGMFGEPPSFGLSELVGVGAAIIILLFTFGSVLAMGLPLLNAIFGLGVGLAAITIVTHTVSMPEFAPQLAIMIGLGVGIDYALFIITRFRHGIHHGLEPEVAVVKAVATSGKAVFFAGCTVIISLAGMYSIGIDFVSGLATGAIIAVALTIATSLTLLPAILGFVGRNIDKLHVPGVSRGEHERDGFWYRWSRLIQRRPVPFAIGALLVLLVLASPVSTIQLGSSDDGNRPTSDTTRRAYDLLADGFGPGFNGPLLLAFDVPAGVGDDALARVHDELAATPGVQFALPASFNPQHDAAVMPVFLTTSPQDPKSVSLIHHLRVDVLPNAVQGTGIDAHVGGITAAFDDVSTYVEERLPLFIGVVLLLSFLLLLVVFRSLLVPLKAVIMNLLSIGAAYGALVAVFQKGIGASLIDVKQGPIESFLPMMLFAILFGLSMDYEVFLLSRVKEEYDRTHDNAAAVADGVNATARVITAAALIMVMVFGSFMFGDDRVLKEFGFGLAVAIFVDATIVRMVLVPATMELLGDANWWLPKWLDRLLPNVHIEGEPDLDHEIEELLDTAPVVEEKGAPR